jgi:hypothetical protein
MKDDRFIILAINKNHKIAILVSSIIRVTSNNDSVMIHLNSNEELHVMNSLTDVVRQLNSNN